MNRRTSLFPFLAAAALALALSSCETSSPSVAPGGEGGKGGFVSATGGSFGTGGDGGGKDAGAGKDTGTGGKDAGVVPADAAFDAARDAANLDGSDAPATKPDAARDAIVADAKVDAAAMLDGPSKVDAQPIDASPIDAPSIDAQPAPTDTAPADVAPASDTMVAMDAAQPDGGASVDPGYGDLAALDKACTPTLTLTLEDTGPKGQIFLDAMGGTAKAAEATVLQISRDVCRVLYRNASEVRAANALELIIRDYNGVAGKWGDLGDIGIQISTQHLQNVKNQGRDVAAEIKGILFHEITHMFQQDDKPEGTWSGLANYYEAGADAVRIRSGFAPAGCKPSKSGQWYDHNYCSGGWWWLWVDTKHPGFIYRLNLQMKGNDKKAWQPVNATSIAGVSLDDLWTEYKTASCCSGASTTCCK